jgi:methylenetetrahydrofolate reductase (NADPH)
MTKIHELLADGPTYSFEMSGPKTPEQEARLEQVLADLEALHPSYVSVTYGAGGSTREGTLEIVEHLSRNTSMLPMPHLTCVAHTHDQIVELVKGYADLGLHNLLALGGDPPVDGESPPSDFRYATELVELARELGDFSIGVAAFPEKHPRSPDLATDRRYLAEKLRLADFAITQFFWDADDYFRMLDDLAALGLDKPVLPGLMAFVNVGGLRRMSAMNDARIPDDLQRKLDQVDGDPPRVRELAVEVCTELGQKLLEGGAPGLHLCTLNFARAATDIWTNLGLADRPRRA